jgi:prophage antirepressor-like protein
MLNNIIRQEFQGNEIRITIINDEVFFVGKDVAEVLGYANTRDAILNHVWEEYREVASIDTLGGKQSMAVINEQGVLQLVMGSHKPEARKFQRWVLEDVLPSINKTGNYSKAPLTQMEITLQACQAMVDLEQKQKRIQLQLVEQSEVLAEQSEVISKIEERTQQFETPEGYETINEYLSTRSQAFTVSCTRGGATQKLGLHLSSNKNTYTKFPTKVWDMKAGREVNAYLKGSIEDALVRLLVSMDLIMYESYHGKPQIKTYAEFTKAKRIKVTYFSALAVATIKGIDYTLAQLKALQTELDAQ